jgi:glutamate-5-semialdehyde dehydrogenase
MSIQEVCRAAKEASVELALLTRARKDDALEHVADALERRFDEILRDNADDLAAARRDRLPEALVDRLLLDEARLRDLIATVLAVKAQADPVGQIVRGWLLPNGLQVRQLRVPLGVVAVVYESRPGVTVDAAALCLKTGNAVILRGGSAARHTNRILAEVIEGAVLEAGLPARAVSHLSAERDELLELLNYDDLVDVIIPRGGSELMGYLRAHSRIPVLFASGGNCHIYVDAAANLEKALAIVINAKVQRPGGSSAAETLLVHQAVAADFLPGALTELSRRGVELAVDKVAAGLVPDLPVKRVSRAHFEAEFLALKLAVRVVASLDEAIEHIATYGTRHSEAIITEDLTAASAFTRRVDAACVYVNASTRFTDGEQLGFGAEVGVSTQKLHARGPIGLTELTCAKYVVWGDGQVRA